MEVPPIIARVLASRGITEQGAVRDLISPTLQSLKSPQTLKDISRAVDRLLQAYQKQEHVVIYGDFDLDGTSGVALLKTALNDLGFTNVHTYQPQRMTQGYGFHAEVVQLLRKQGATLIVTVDVGMTAFEACEEAKAKGIDVIVTDHHLPGKSPPLAYAIVNPNQQGCESGLGHLCGTGVAFYLYLALRKKMQEGGHITGALNCKSYLDFFVIATLADRVPMREENRVLSKHGLHILQNTHNPGLRELLKRLGLLGQHPLRSQDVAIQVAPKLNALSRINQELLPLDILLCDKNQAPSKVEQALAINQIRRDLQKQSELVALNRVDEQEVEVGFACVCDKELHKGVLGLVANFVVEKFAVPAFIATQDELEVSGSARCPSVFEGTSFSLVEALKYAADHVPDFSGQFGGHKAAAGFHMKRELWPLFHEGLYEYFQTYDKSIQKDKTLAYLPDAVGGLEEIDSLVMDWLEKMEPYGKGFEYPLFLINNAEVTRIGRMRGGHLRLSLFGGGQKREAVYFSPPQHFVPTVGERFTGIKVEARWNEYRGVRTIQLVIKDTITDQI